MYLDDGGSTAMASEPGARARATARRWNNAKPRIQGGGNAVLLLRRHLTLDDQRQLRPSRWPLDTLRVRVFTAKDRVVRAINALGVGKTVCAYKIAAVIQRRRVWKPFTSRSPSTLSRLQGQHR